MTNQSLTARLQLWIGDVDSGRLARREFIQHLAAVGLAPSMAAMLLQGTATAQSAPAFVHKPTQRGRDGVLRALLWLGPTQLKTCFSTPPAPATPPPQPPPAATFATSSSSSSTATPGA